MKFLSIFFTLFSLVILYGQQNEDRIPVTLSLSHKQIDLGIEKSIKKNNLLNQSNKKNNIDYVFIKKYDKVKAFCVKEKVFLEIPAHFEGRRYYSFFKKFFIEYSFSNRIVVEITLLVKKNWQVSVDFEYYSTTIKDKHLKIFWGKKKFSVNFLAFLLKRQIKREVKKGNIQLNNKLKKLKFKDKIAEFWKKSNSSFLISKDYNFYLNNKIEKITWQKLYCRIDSIAVNFFLHGKYQLSFTNDPNFNTSKDLPPLQYSKNKKQDNYFLNWNFNYNNFSVSLSDNYFKKNKFYYSSNTNSYLKIKDFKISAVQKNDNRKIVVNGNLLYTAKSLNINPFTEKFFQQKINTNSENSFQISGTPYFDKGKQSFSLIDLEKKITEYNFVFALVLLNNQEKVNKAIDKKISLNLKDLFEKLKTATQKRIYLNSLILFFGLKDIKVDRVTFKENSFQGRILVDHWLDFKIDLY